MPYKIPNVSWFIVDVKNAADWYSKNLELNNWCK